MDDLIERLEKATGPDRATDIEIGQLVYPDREWFLERIRWMVEPFTASIDAALTLVPEGYASAVGTMAFRDNDMRTKPNWPWATYWTPGGEPFTSNGRTPAIALCIAAIKARQLVTAGDPR